jgi:hypothetical protein
MSKTDKAMLQRLTDIEKLDQEDKKTIVHVIVYSGIRRLKRLIPPILNKIKMLSHN